MKTLVFFTLLLACVRVAYATAPLTAESRQHALSQLTELRQSESSGWDSPESTFDAISAYNQLDAPAVPHGAKLCPTLQKALDAAVAASDFDDLHYAAASAALLRCSGFTAPSATKSVLQAGLNDADVEDVYHASQAVFALSELKNTVTLKDFDFSKVSSNLLVLLEEDGTFRSTPEDEEGSAYHAGLALETLAEVAQKVSGAVDKAAIRQVADKAPALMKTGYNLESKRVDFTHGAPADVSPLEAVATVLDGIKALSAASADALDIKKPVIIALGEYVLRHSVVANVQDADALSSAVNFLADNNIFVPYFIKQTESTTTGNFKFTITNIRGEPTTKLNVLVESCKKAGGKGPGLKDLVFTPKSDAADNTEYFLNESSASQLARALPGFFDFKLNIVPKSGSPAKFKPQAQIDVRGKIDWAPLLGQRLEIAISNSATKPNAKEGDVVKTLRYPESLDGVADQTFDAAKHLHLKLKFDKDEPTPSSVFLHFSNANGREALFVLKPVADEEESFALKLSFGASELIEALDGPGAYALSIVFGDASIERAVTWKAAVLNLNLPQSGRASFDAQFSPKPTFLHQFRTPDHRPSTFVSLVFTVVVLAPLGLLFVTLASSGIKFQLPTNPSEFLYAVVFQGSIAAILFVYTLYWLSLNIFQALALLAVCGIVAAFSGTGALRLLHQRTKGKTHAE